MKQVLTVVAVMPCWRVPCRAAGGGRSRWRAGRAVAGGRNPTAGAGRGFSGDLSGLANRPWDREERCCSPRPG